MNITLGNCVRLPLGREPRVEAAIPVDFTEMTALTLSFSPSLPRPAESQAAVPLPVTAVAAVAYEESFDQFDELLTPLGSSALSDWPL